MDDDEGLVLNLALPDAGPARAPTRSQQRKEKWHEKRLLKARALPHAELASLSSVERLSPSARA